MRLVFTTPDDGNYFFGYYDKSPFNLRGDKLLACRSTFCDRAPGESDLLEIGYFDWKSNDNFQKISTTKTWNWQQGCMLQWFGVEREKKIIYNDIRDDQFSTIVLDLDTNDELVYPMAYYCLSSNSEFALCIDNERHYWFRDGYSYQGIKNKAKSKKIDYDDGIWKISFCTSNPKMEKILSFEELYKFNTMTSMYDAAHYIEHLMINPNDSRFVFLHRWKMESGDIYTRLYSVNIDGTDLRLLNDSGRMSHFCWKNETNILGWGGVSNPVNSIRKYKSLVKYFIKPLLPVYKFLSKGNANIVNLVSGDSYLEINDENKHISKIFTNQLKYDGHPSFINNNTFITDTYPNEANLNVQSLYVIDIVNGSVELIDEIKHSPLFSGTTCRSDLHPKVSFCGGLISVDTLENDIRAIRVYE